MLTCLKPLNMRARRDCQNFTEPRSIAQNLRCNVHGSLPRARAEALDMSSCFAPGDEHLRTDQSALPAHAVNGTLRCAPHGKRESESGRNAERASSSQQHEREGRRELNHMQMQAAPTCDGGYCWERLCLVAQHDKVTINAAS